MLSHTLESFLEDRQACYRLEYHALALSSLRTARSARIDAKCLAKSVLLEDEDGPLLAVLPATRRLAVSRVHEHMGRQVRISREDDTGRFFPDCVFGALPPVGAAFGLPTVVDRSFESLPEIFFEGGDHETLVHMQGAGFLELLDDAIHADIASESPAWIAARKAREHLHGSIQSLNDAIAAPMANGERWRRRVRREFVGLQHALVDHIVRSEAPGALLGEIEGQAPHLARGTEKLRLDHRELTEATARMWSRMDESNSVATLRRGILALLDRYATHRHLGADLVYEAYGFDIGGG